MGKDIEVLAKLDSGLKSLKGIDNNVDKADQFQDDVNRNVLLSHDLMACRLCHKQYAHTSATTICMSECPDKVSDACLSCTKYCSICDFQFCSRHPFKGNTILRGGCRHSNGERLIFCSEHVATNSCDSCGIGKCEVHLQACAEAEEWFCRCCNDCCELCEGCLDFYCTEHIDQLEHDCGEEFCEGILQCIFRLFCTNENKICNKKCFMKTFCQVCNTLVAMSLRI